MTRINRNNKRVSRYESNSARQAKIDFHQHGEGHFVFQNITKGTITLPKPAVDGSKYVLPGAMFEGDSYFVKALVRPNLARLVREIKTEIAPPVIDVIVEAVVEPSAILNENKEDTMNESKLLLDQPDTITQKGKVEHVVVDNTPKAKKLNEQQKKKPTKEELEAASAETLLLDGAIEGVQILG